MSAPELLPCPFCGEAAEIERLGTHRQSTIYVCTICGCRLETGEEFNHSGRWNRRSDLAASAIAAARAEGAAEERERCARIAEAMRSKAFRERYSVEYGRKMYQPYRLEAAINDALNINAEDTAAAIRKGDV